ncbi:MAG: hypothetical protein JJE04_08505 [Acidobacteriia bacterium]|nr:hypothetical protein [Terriglobia bacterium]
MPVAENRHRGWVGPVLLLLLISGFYWKLVLTDQFTWLRSNDIAYQVLPWYQFQVGEVQQGRLPLWDPYVMGGQPLIGQAQPGTAYPLNWLLFVLPTRYGWIRQIHLHWYFVLIHYLGALFAYWLCRDLRVSRGAAITGGLLFSLGGYVGQTDWPQMLNGAVWAPLVLMFTLRCLRGQRAWASAGMGGVCLGVSVLSGHHQAPIYIALAMGGLWLWAICKDGSPDWKMARLAVLFFLVAGLTSGLQSAPGYEYSKLAYRWVSTPEPVTHAQPVPYQVHANFSLTAKSLVGIVFPGFVHHASTYAGFTAVSLALLGWARAWGRQETRLCVFLTLGGLLYAFGSNVVFHGMVYSLVPLAEKARNASMASLIFHLGLSALAAIGLDRILDRELSVWVLRVQKAAFALAAVVLVGLYFIFLTSKGEFQGDISSGITALIALLVAACFHGRITNQLTRQAALLCLGSLMLIELGMGHYLFMPHNLDLPEQNQLTRMAQDNHLVETLRKLPDARAEFGKEGYAHNAGDWYGVDLFHGYLASLTSNLHKMRTAEVRVRELYGVRYHIGKEPVPGWDRQVASFNGDWKIFENPNAFPRAWVVHQASQAKTEVDVRKALDGKDFNLRKEAFFQTGPLPQLDSCTAASEAWVLNRVSNHVAMYAELGCKGMLVLNDNYYPGWVASVDGQPAPILEAYSALRGVVVPAGRHLVEMRYRPYSVYLGALMTLVGLGIGFVLQKLH